MGAEGGLEGGEVPGVFLADVVPLAQVSDSVVWWCRVMRRFEVSGKENE